MFYVFSIAAAALQTGNRYCRETGSCSSLCSCRSSTSLMTSPALSGMHHLDGLLQLSSKPPRVCAFNSLTVFPPVESSLECKRRTEDVQKRNNQEIETDDKAKRLEADDHRSSDIETD